MKFARKIHDWAKNEFKDALCWSRAGELK